MDWNYFALPWHCEHSWCSHSHPCTASDPFPDETPKKKQEFGISVGLTCPLKTRNRNQHICKAQTLTRYSNTSVRHLSVWIMSWRVTILACFKSFSRDTARGRNERPCDNLFGGRSAQTLTWPYELLGPCRPVSVLLPHHTLSAVPSRIAVQGAPSSCSSRISFRATKLSVNLLRPLKTVAYVPCRDENVWMHCDLSSFVRASVSGSHSWSHLSQFVQLDVGFKFPEADFRLKKTKTGRQLNKLWVLSMCTTTEPVYFGFSRTVGQTRPLHCV